MSVVIIFFSWRSIHCEPISIRDTIKLHTSSTINSSAYKLDQRIANFARSNQLNDSHIANKKDRQFDYCDDDDANDGDDDDDDDDHDDHNDDDGEAGEPRRAVASWLVGSRCGSRSPASGNSGPPMHCSHIVIYGSTCSRPHILVSTVCVAAQLEYKGKIDNMVRSCLHWLKLPFGTEKFG